MDGQYNRMLWCINRQELYHDALEKQKWRRITRTASGTYGHWSLAMVMLTDVHICKTNYTGAIYNTMVMFIFPALVNSAKASIEIIPAIG